METVKCSKCGKGEDAVRLIEYRYQGKKEHVCVRCLPVFVHGG